MKSDTFDFGVNRLPLMEGGVGLVSLVLGDFLDRLSSGIMPIGVVQTGTGRDHEDGIGGGEDLRYS